jgi:hypothetical protein
MWDPLRPAPRFQWLLRKVNFALLVTSFLVHSKWPFRNNTAAPFSFEYMARTQVLHCLRSLGSLTVGRAVERQV